MRVVVPLGMPAPQSRRRAGRRLTVLTLALVSAACGGEGEERAASAVTVVDSAGIEIVESSAPSWARGEEWRVGTAPTLEIGMAEGPAEYLLSNVRSARRRSDGSVAVANGGSAEIRIYGPDGRHLRTVGGRGGGPGEFQMLLWIQTLPGDSLLAYDLGARRLSLFSPAGDFVTSTTIGGEAEGRSMVIGAFADRSLVATASDFRSLRASGDGPVRLPEFIVRIAATGELLDTLSTQPGTETYMQSGTMSGGMQMVSMTTPLFGRTQVSAILGDRAVLGSNDRYELQLVEPDGRLARLIRRRVEPRPVTEPMLEAARRERIDRAPSPEARTRQEEAMRSIPHAATVPFYERLLGDDEGNLWVQEFTVPGEPPPGWAVYDPDGRLLGSVALPDGFRPTHIGGDFVVGVGTDEMDVQRVRMYALEKPAAP